jgi:hypothetical protein
MSISCDFPDRETMRLCDSLRSLHNSPCVGSTNLILLSRHRSSGGELRHPSGLLSQSKQSGARLWNLRDCLKTYYSFRDASHSPMSRSADATFVDAQMPEALLCSPSFSAFQTFTTSTGARACSQLYWSRHCSIRRSSQTALLCN